MESQNANSTINKEAHKGYPAKPLTFYDDGTYAFTNIEHEIIMRLGITPSDKFTQEAIDDNRIVLIRHKETA